MDIENIAIVRATNLTPQEIVELEKSKVRITDEIEFVCDKYSYSIELEEALKRCIPAMTKGKSKEEIELLRKTLKEVEIYELRRKPKKEQLDYISETKIGERNKHVKYGKQDLGEYGKDIAPEAYHYDIIFDEEMNAIDKSEYIYITRLSKEDQVSKTYGTQIDLSALIHGLGHAWVARKEPYKQMENGNVIVRDGMRTDTLIVNKEQKTVEYGETKGLYLEEAINTVEEENALTQILGVSSIDEIEGYKKSTYQSSVMNTIVRAYLEKLGANKPLETARILNDKSGLEVLQESYSKTNFVQKIQNQEYINQKENDFLTDIPENAKEFFKKYKNIYFSTEKKQDFLENIDSVLEQLFTLFGGYQMIRLNT